ncbi:UbiA family prenyltransferase [Nocardioides halotolerans]|uniref:UbiA family prenyltransferase n=1 Tax=Nocardioides halotolerans TaxID=433660 RepID=UPI0009FF574D|nr:UbiA family prenyltransferase [Nocardioides halotolerans]
MAREGRWGRGRAARREAVDTAGAVHPGDGDAPPASSAPSATAAASAERGWRAREQRAAQRRAARATATAPEDDTLTEPAPEPATEPAPEPTAAETAGPEPGEDGAEPSRFRLRDLTPFLLVRAAHPRQALVTAVGMTVAAALAGRPSRELLLILATVLVGQVCLGWFNDLVDRKRDARHRRTGKPLADGRLDPGTVWFCLALAIFLVVPLSVANGMYAGPAYLASLAIGLLGQWVWLRKGLLSWLPWAAAFALYPAFLSYGGWGGQEKGAPPELVITGLAALLGIGVHLLTALWGLVPDNEDRWTYLPLRLGLRIGASKLLWVAGTYTVLVLVALAFAGTHVGLGQEPLQP